MNKNVVITGTVLSLIKIFQHNDQIFDGLEKNFRKVLKQHSVADAAFLTTMFVGTTATYSLLQKYVSKEKDSKWQTLDSLSTIAAILFEGILIYNLRRKSVSRNNNNNIIPFQTFFTNNPKTLKILSSIFTITTLMGHKRGTNPLNSFLALLFIELIVLVNTLRFDKSGEFINMAKSSKLGMVLLILLPFLWDHFEKGKNGKEKENDASKYYTYANITRLLIVFLILFLYFGGDKAFILLIKLLLKSIKIARKI